MARQWQPLLTAMQGLGRGCRQAAATAHPARRHKLRTLRQLQHQLEQEHGGADYWQRRQTRLQQQQHECRSSSGRASGQGAGAVAAADRTTGPAAPAAGAWRTMAAIAVSNVVAWQRSP